MNECRKRYFQPVSWPVFSPSLGPLEVVWDNMKDYTQRNYASLGGGKQRWYDSLGAIDMEALGFGGSMTTEFVSGLIDNMLARCKAVVEVVV